MNKVQDKAKIQWRSLTMWIQYTWKAKRFACLAGFFGIGFLSSLLFLLMNPWSLWHVVVIPPCVFSLLMFVSMVGAHFSICDRFPFVSRAQEQAARLPADKILLRGSHESTDDMLRSVLAGK